jgi:hypothetical protein
VQVQKSPEHVSASSVQMKGENKSCSSEIDCLFVCFFFFSFCDEQNDWHKSPRATYHHHHLSSSSLQKMSAASTLSPQKI